MAEKNENWFGSWLSAAKNKSCEVLEFVKKDLEEFGSAVKSEASSVVTNTGSAIERTLKLDEPESTASNMKRSISSFLGQMNEVLNPSPDDSDTEAILITEGQESVTLSRLQQAVYKLQSEEKTFLEDPGESLKKQYECWLEIIEDHLSEERLSKHLLNSVTLKNQYTSLVPLKVDHGLFWKRYLFKKALLEDDIARQEAMEKREAKENNKVVSEETVQWEEEDFAKDIELTEEEQIKLLEQYENETKQKSSQRKSSSPKIVEELPEEKLVVQQATVKVKSKKGRAKNAPNRKLAEKITEIAVPPEKKVDIEIVNKDAVNGVASNSSSSSSTDGDWEKISDTDK